MQRFCEWVAEQRRFEEAPAAEKLALVIARSGAAGVSLEDLARALNLPAESLQDILRALTATGQVTMLRVNGRLVYRAAG